jgi:hypothetical protein
VSCKKPREHSRTNRSAPEFRREHLPGNAAANDKDNAGQTRAIRDARPSAFWSGGGGIGKNGWTRSHNASGSSVAPTPRSRYLGRRGSGFGGFVKGVEVVDDGGGSAQLASLGRVIQPRGHLILYGLRAGGDGHLPSICGSKESACIFTRCSTSQG